MATVKDRPADGDQALTEQVDAHMRLLRQGVADTPAGGDSHDVAGDLIDSAQGRSQPTGDDLNEREDDTGQQGKPYANRTRSLVRLKKATSGVMRMRP
jgi:hypothetical protein